MTAQQNQQDYFEAGLKEAQVENDLLLTQIHQLEEELEHYFLRNQELEKGQQAGSGGAPVVWVDDELPETMAENQRLQALVDVMRKTHQLEMDNALNVKIGNILIEAVDSPGKLFSVPGKLWKIWRESSRTKSPKVLGGKGFDKVITAYNDGGFEAVENLMEGNFILPVIQAKAYTVLARQVMNSDRIAAAEAARSAYQLDPKPFRLKWLAFRLYEADYVIEGEAMMDVLPADIKFSESEARQANQFCNEAKHVRQRQARKRTRFSERRAEFERHLESLSLEQGNLSKVKVKNEEDNELLLLQLHQTQEELEQKYLKCQTLEQAQVLREQEVKVLAVQKEKQAKLADDRQVQIQQLTQVKEQMEEDNELFLNQLFEELESQYVKYETLEQGKLALVNQKDEQSMLAADLQSQIEQSKVANTALEAERVREIEGLHQTQEKLEQEKKVLALQKDEQFKLAADLQSQIEQSKVANTALEAGRARGVEALHQTQEKLEQKKKALARQKDEHAKLAADQQAQIDQVTEANTALEAGRVRDIEALHQTQEKLEQKKKALARQKDEHAKLAADQQAQIDQVTEVSEVLEAERVREIEGLRETQEKLEQEKTALVRQKDEQSKLASDRLRKIDEMQQTVQVWQASEAELTARQQTMHEEMVRAEAQLDLIKDMLLRDPGL